MEQNNLNLVHAVLQHPIVVDQIYYQTMNVTGISDQEHPSYKMAKRNLEDFAEQVVILATDTLPEAPVFEGDWRQEFADTTERKMMERGLRDIIDATFAKLMKDSNQTVKGRCDNYGKLSLRWVADNVGQVSRMIQLCLDPNILLDDSENALLRRTKQLAESMGGATIIAITLE